MEKSYESGLATHVGPESCGAARKGSVEYRATSTIMLLQPGESDHLGSS
jgi:hypothetical protein